MASFPSEHIATQDYQQLLHATQEARSNLQAMFNALLRQGARPKLHVDTGSSSTSGNGKSTRSASSTRIPGRVRRGPGFQPKLRMYTATEASIARQAAFCTPDCPIEEVQHCTGQYHHNGELNQSLSFLFGAQNPPPDIWLAHDKLMNGDASEEEEELVLAFLAHHPFQAGNVTERIYFGEEGQLTMTGNPLSYVAAEVPQLSFEPVRVAPVTSHPLLMK